MTNIFVIPWGQDLDRLIQARSTLPSNLKETISTILAAHLTQSKVTNIWLFFIGMLLFNFRPSDAADLRMSDARLPVGGSDGELSFRRVKTLGRHTVSFECGPKRHQWLKECIELARSEGRPVEGAAPLIIIICIGGRSRIRPGGWTTSGLDNAVARVCEGLGVSFTPYLIRHSATSWAAKQAGIGRAEVQAYAGHAKASTTDKYIHITAADAIPAYQAMEDFMKSRDSKTCGG